MTNHILDAVAAIKLEITRLEGALSVLETGSKMAAPAMAGGAKGSVPAKVKQTRGGKKRSRRSSEEVSEQAEAMAEFIKSKGKTGATTAEIVGEFGKVLPSIKTFVTSKVDAKLKTTGAGRATVYLID